MSDLSSSLPLTNLTISRTANSTSPKIAKRSAAFFACKILRSAGCLDNHFLPHIVAPAEEKVDASGNAIGTKRHQVEWEKAVPKAFEPLTPCGEVTTFYASLIHYGGDDGSTIIKEQLYRPIVLLTRNPLPQVPTLTLYVDGNALPVYVTPYGSVSVTVDQRKLLTAYSLELWRSMTGKEIRIAREWEDGKETKKELDLVYFLAEVKRDFKIDAGGLRTEEVEWERMETAVRDKEVKLDWRNLPDLEDTIIIDEAKHGCRYSFNCVRHDLHPDSVLPPGRQSDKHPSIKTLMD